MAELITRAGPKPSSNLPAVRVPMAADAPATRSMGRLAASHGYDLASPGYGARFYPTSSATALLAPSLERMRAACRALVRNNPHAKAAVRIMAQNLVRYGITPQFDPKNKRVSKAMEKAWQEWVPLADVKGAHDLYGIMHTAVWQMFEVGECFIRKHLLTDAEANEIGLTIPFQLEIIESEQLTMDSWTTDDGQRVINGVQVNARGRPVGYWFYAKNSDDPASAMVREKVFISAREIIHLFDPKRGQYRGEPYLSVIGTRLESLDTYSKALLTRAQIEACFAAFVEQAADMMGGGQAPIDPAIGAVIEEGGADGPGLEHIQPGMVHYLRKGEKVSFSSPQSSGGLEVFCRETLRSIATGLGIPYEILTCDLSDVSYTSFRAGAIQFKDQIECLQWLILIPQMCVPIMQMFTFVGFLKGKWPTMVPLGVTWGIPRQSSIDPAKDAMAMLIELKAGITTFAKIKAERGEDWRRDLEEAAEVEEFAKSIGLGGFMPEGFAGDKVAAESGGDAKSNQTPEGDGPDPDQTPRQKRKSKGTK